MVILLVFYFGGKVQYIPPCFGISFGGTVGSCVGLVIIRLPVAICFSK
jgi:hypothetical protein